MKEEERLRRAPSSSSGSNPREEMWTRCESRAAGGVGVSAPETFLGAFPFQCPCDALARPT